jgi:hypothetical protein
MKRFLMLLLAGFSLLGLAGGCAVHSVQPWERDLLSKEQMQPTPDPVENMLDEHIYFSKEASTGGTGVGGGGCGCN